MRFILFFTVLLFSISSCDDGDFEVPSFEFNSTVNSCGTYVLYRTNSSQTEALILQFNPDEIQQEEVVYSIAINSENCSYRIFDDTIGSDYFCSDVPPIHPIVIKNWEAKGGPNNFINVETTSVTDDLGVITGYIHEITLTNLVLESNSDTMTFESYHFGSFETQV